MTVSGKIDVLRQIPAFQGCSEETFETLSARSQVVRFGIGQALSSASLVPERVLLIVSGKARLLGQHNNQLNTLALLGPGNLIGLPSLLRAEGCEEVSASTDLEALALPDALIAEIYAKEASFRLWCNSTVFPAELASLLQTLARSKRAIALRNSGCAEGWSCRRQAPWLDQRCHCRYRSRSADFCGQCQHSSGPQQLH